MSKIRNSNYLQRLKSLEALLDNMTKVVTKYATTRFEDLLIEDYAAIQECINTQFPGAKYLIKKLRERVYEMSDDEQIIKIEDILVDLENKNAENKKLTEQLKKLSEEKAVQESPNKDLHIEVLMLREEKVNKARIATEVRANLIKQGFVKSGIMIKAIDRIIKA